MLYIFLFGDTARCVRFKYLNLLGFLSTCELIALARSEDFLLNIIIKMIKSKTKIEKQTKKKTNSILVETIRGCKKNPKWLEIASILSGPRRKLKAMNLDEIEKQAKEGEIIIIPGKVLSQGELNKKIKIIALNFSEKAKEKLLKSKHEILSIIDGIKKYPEAKGVKILKWK